MEIKILHIDDEQDVLERAAKIISGKQIDGYVFQIKDSCGFEEGMAKLLENEYDLVILDLCIGKASAASDKVGEEIFNEIKKRSFIPVIFFTGLPDYVRHLATDIVKVVGKADGYDCIFEEFKNLLDSGFIQLKNDVNNIVREGLRSYFWNFVNPNSKVISELREDEVSLKYLLLRRLARTLSSELTRTAVENPSFNNTNCHPMEFYIYPPLDGEYEAGDIVQCANDQKLYVLLTPSCDLVLRSDDKRSADKVLLVEARNFKEVSEVALLYQKLEIAKKEIQELTEKDEKIPLQKLNLPSNLEESIKSWLRPNKKERYFFLPKTPFLPATLIDFQHKASITYDELEKNYTTIASLDDPISQAVLANYTRYYSRIGYNDLDINYAFDQID